MPVLVLLKTGSVPVITRPSSWKIEHTELRRGTWRHKSCWTWSFLVLLDSYFLISCPTHVSPGHWKTGGYSLIMRCFPLQKTETSLEAIRPRQSKSCQCLISKQMIISKQFGSVSRLPTYLSRSLEANLHTIVRAAPNWRMQFGAFEIKWICFMTKSAETELKWSLQRSFQTYLRFFMWQKTEFVSF